VVSDVIDAGPLALDTPKVPVSLRFPINALEILFLRLFPETGTASSKLRRTGAKEGSAAPNGLHSAVVATHPSAL
jgi:hypothetical protein